jgi:hypothetical protein
MSTENTQAVESAEVKVEAPVVEVKAAAPSKSEAPAPGTPEFAAWAWANRGA